MNDNLQSSNIPAEGTPEFDEYMKNNFGDEYELGYRVGFGRRLGAAILDLIFTSILSLLVYVLTGTYAKIISIAGDITNNFAQLQSMLEESAPIITVVILLYYSTEIFIAASPGKKVLGIKIANENRTEGDFNTLLVRFVAKHINTILSLIATVFALNFFNTIASILAIVILIGFFFTLGKKRQAFHDMISGSAVYFNENIKTH